MRKDMILGAMAGLTLIGNGPAQRDDGRKENAGPEGWKAKTRLSLNENSLSSVINHMNGSDKYCPDCGDPMPYNNISATYECLVMDCYLPTLYHPEKDGEDME